METPQLLLVDDEAGLAELLKRYLERTGYRVFAFTEPELAIASMEAEPERYALLITDLTLPRINGEELIARLRKHNPSLPAIIASGYPYQPVAPNVEFVQKPFLPRMLIEAIERLLGQRADGARSTS